MKYPSDEKLKQIVEESVNTVMYSVTTAATNHLKNCVNCPDKEQCETYKKYGRFVKDEP